MKGQILKDLLKDAGQYELKGDHYKVVKGLAIDSRQVTEGGLFAALKGAEMNGHDFIDQAITNGARFIVCESLPKDVLNNITYVKVNDSKYVIGIIADAYYNHPSSKLKCVGVTGTNGKTTITTLLYNLFKELGYKVGLISTIEILVNEKKCKTDLTTPDVIRLHSIIAEMVDANCSHVFMEVSSHAADQQRIAGLNFEGGIFTNITHDHLDYHGDFANYIRAKQAFFTGLNAKSFALLNADDRNESIMIQNSKAKCYKFSSRILTDYKFKVLSEELIGMQIEINEMPFYSRLSGKYNASNLAAVYGAADLLEGFDKALLIEKLSGLRAVRGRMEMVAPEPQIFVDYAHTPDALYHVMRTINEAKKQGRLIIVVGCGGDRDKAKRPLMGLMAVENSDQAIFTSDNPRNENPGDIISDMIEHIPDELKSKFLKIENRESAIRVALTIADKKDVVLVAGKGHEEYQEIKGVKHFFSDQQIVKDILSEDI